MSDSTAAQRAPQQEKAVGLSGSTLKLIAIVTMFIDHLGVVAFETQISNYMVTYYILRLIGRLAFPIFCGGRLFPHPGCKKICPAALSFCLYLRNSFRLGI